MGRSVSGTGFLKSGRPGSESAVFAPISWCAWILVCVGGFLRETWGARCLPSVRGYLGL